MAVKTVPPPLFFIRMGKKDKTDGVALVARALAGLDSKAILVNSKRYVIHPPTIRRICRAGTHLSGYGEGGTISELLSSISDMGRLAQALSCFIQGDEGLAGELAEGTPEEVVKGLETAYGMISPQAFTRAVSLARSVSGLIAKRK